MRIRETSASDRDNIILIHTLAFDQADEADLTTALLDDPSAAPVLSLIAFDDHQVVGHILFSKAGLTGLEVARSIAILAPLAVVPEAQGQGVGGMLIEDGLRRLRDAGVDLVFVLGHPDYYPRHGFESAGRMGLDAPFPIAEEHADAWMVQALRPDVLGKTSGIVKCAGALNKPKYWQE